MDPAERGILAEEFADAARQVQGLFDYMQLAKTMEEQDTIRTLMQWLPSSTSPVILHVSSRWADQHIPRWSSRRLLQSSPVWGSIDTFLVGGPAKNVPKNCYACLQGLRAFPQTFHACLQVLRAFLQNFLACLPGLRAVPQSCNACLQGFRSFPRSCYAYLQGLHSFPQNCYAC
ncbi:Hypothetical protein SMAX5B_021350 [Scophthalmus maximus]|uniref:Uncharacterized protein n=1 Tax=Scophthalmus maximus TaxID=52904 RepID=A0A2U9BLJ7_SCOMX|nr:Hypothetical protein SMAX5B_021350 [Scophthalmus maximus]